VYCIGQDWNFGIEAIAAFKRKLKEIAPSIEIVGEILHKPGEKEYAPYISQAIAAKPDVIFSPNWGNDLRLVIKQAISLGLKLPWATYFLGDVENIKAIGTGDELVGSVACEGYQLTIPGEGNKIFRKGFYEKYGIYPTWTAGKAYVNVMFWAEAIKAAGKDDIEAVKKAWEGLEYKGIAGDMVMRACDHQTIRPVWLAEIVKKSEFYDHPHVGEAFMIPAEDVITPAKETGCPRCK
jgi:branched-chain amino acid transport system substrate-binding protein